MKIARRDLDVWRGFLNAHAAVVRRIERELAAEGLPSLGWYDVLWAVRRAPGRRLRMGELSDRVVLSRTGLTRLVDRIESAGHLRREPVPGDRRGSFVVITPSGTELLRRMWPVYERSLLEHFVPALAGSRSDLRRVLERLAAR